MNSLLHKIFIILVLLISAAIVHANEVQDIDNEELKLHMQNGVPVIDVRATSEWKETGVVDGSHLIMFFDEKGKYDLNTWLNEVAQIANKNDPLILICHSGGRSKQLGNYLVKVAGYEKVYNVRKGIVSWIKKNNPTMPVQ